MLCPWCDELLPDEISPTLDRLMRHAEKVSIDERRKRNPLGLVAPFTVSGDVCKRHRFEKDLVPLAEEHGWPSSIDWYRTYTRLQDLKPVLQKILDDADVDWKTRTAPSDDPSSGTYNSEEEDEDELRAHPRWGSIFWKSLLKAIHKSSSLHVAGLRGQMKDFSASAPG